MRRGEKLKKKKYILKSKSVNVKRNGERNKLKGKEHLLISNFHRVLNLVCILLDIWNR